MIRLFPEKEVGGLQGWYWIETDSGAWDGPKDDWESSHLSNINKYCKNFRTVVQAGGNLGMYPKLLSRLFTKVYTFEPDSLNFLCLSLNCQEENIIKFQSALGSKRDVCIMDRITMANVGMHRVNPTTNKNLAAVPVMELDKFEFTDVDLLMLDLELYEIHALKGAVKLLEENSPVVFTENPSQEIIDFLKERGYELVAQSKMDGIFVKSS